MQYLLLDGAMTPDSSAKQTVLADNKAKWCEPLLGVQNLRMFSPFLIDLHKVFQIGGGLQKSLTDVVNACPMHLHVSYFESDLELPKISNHLSKFICFRDQDMQTYGLRLADCRISSVLPQVLTKQQWTYLTSPIATWKIHTRRGELTSIPVYTSEGSLEDEYVFSLNADQVDALVVLIFLAWCLNTIWHDMSLSTRSRKPNLSPCSAVKFVCGQFAWVPEGAHDAVL